MKNYKKKRQNKLRLLERLKQKGIHAHKKFTMTSDYNEVKNGI